MKVIFGSKLCRACLRGSDDRIKFFENENSLNQFQYIFNQKLFPNDNLPLSLCKKCNDCMKIAYEFMILCKKSEKRLHSLLEHLTNPDSALDEKKTDPTNTTSNESQLNTNFKPNEKKFVLPMLEVKEEYLDEIEIEEIVEESIINETDWIEETLTLDKSTQIYDENMIIPSLSEPKIAASCESLKNEIVAKTTTIGTTDDNNLDGPLEIFNYTLPNNDDLNKEKIIELEPQSYEIEPSTLRDIINSVKIVNNDDASTNDNEPPEKKLKLSVSGDKPKINQTNQNITNPSTQQQTVKKIIKASVFELADESICMTCDKRFKAETNLIDHMKLVHNCNLILKKFNICHICNTPLSTANVLKRHIESVHTNKRKYKCDFCDKTFNYMEALQSHRRIHTGDRKYVCEICGLGFVSNSALKGHQNSKNAHTAAMNFECDICNQQFKTKLNLTQHIKLHFKADKDLEIEPFYSNQNSSSSLAGATKKVGSKNLYECKNCADTFTNKKEFVTHDRKHKRLLEEIKNLERVNLEMKKKVLLSSIGKNVMSTNFCKFSEA